MQYIRQFCEKYGFEPDATASLSDAYEQLISNGEAHATFKFQVCAYEENHLFDHTPAFAAIEGLQSLTGIHKYTLDLLYLIALTEHLKHLYQQEAIPNDIYDASVCDLKWKARECKNVYGVWGIFVSWWTIGIFKLKLFAIGRLQFELGSFPCSITDVNWEIQEGAPYINVHIPSSGPLDHQACKASYDQAASFFRQRYGLNQIYFGCKSWLLAPSLNGILPPDSRILAFQSDYKILAVEEDSNYRNLFRVFGIRKLPENIQDLPSDTSLQRSLKEQLISGKTIVNGLGIFLYEQEHLQ